MRPLAVGLLALAVLARARSAGAQPAIIATPACDAAQGTVDVSAATAAIEGDLLSLQGASHPRARATLERAEAATWTLCRAGDRNALAYLALVHVARGEDTVALSYLDAYATEASSHPVLRSERLGGFFEAQRDRLFGLAAEVTVTGVPDAAPVSVEGVRVRRRMIRVARGCRLSAVATVDGVEHRATLHVEGAREQLRFRVAPRAVGDVVQRPEAPPTPPARDRSGATSPRDLPSGRWGAADEARPRYRPSVLLVTMVTTATAAWVVTLVSGAVALERTARFGATCPRDPAAGSACLDLLDDRNVAATVSAVGFAAGVATSLASLVIWSAERPVPRQTARLSLGIAGGSVFFSATGRF